MKDYEPGDLVLVRNSRLESTINRFKTQPRYIGPYEVHRKTKGGSYVLKELDGTQIAERFASFRLLKYIYRDDPILYEMAREEAEQAEPDAGNEDIDSDHFSQESTDLDTDVEMNDP